MPPCAWVRRVACNWASQLLVVLQSVQPLTTEVRAVGLDEVVVLTDGPETGVTRADAPVPPAVREAARDKWGEALSEWARSSAVEVVTNDEFCLSECARLRQALGLERRTPEALDAYLDKVDMKTRLAASVPVPRWVGIDRVGTVADMPTPPTGLSYPLVAKPRIGSNSHGVRVICDDAQWRGWVTDRSGQQGWQVEEFIEGRMCFVDAMVIDGHYEPVLVGAYLGGLLPHPDVSVLGAVDVPRTDPLWGRATGLGARVAQVLGDDGRFATHMEFFERGCELVVMEVSARAPGALVSQMARVVAGHNLETAHLAVQAGQSLPAFGETGIHAAWLSVLARADHEYQGPPSLHSDSTTYRMPAPPGAVGRFVAHMALLTNNNHGALVRDVRNLAEHRWYA